MRNTKPLPATSSTASGWEGAEQSQPGYKEDCGERARIRKAWARALNGIVSAFTTWGHASPSDLRGIRSGDVPASAVPRWKRTFDLMCVLVTAPCWLAVMFLVALWIKIVSPGPVFYRQERIGFRGRGFIILKFRSMRVNAETRTHEEHLTNLIRANCPMKKLDSAGDSRLIFGGRLLRALGLDELPQILNIMRGEMSLVGPRPCTPHEFQHYQPWQKERVDALPGLTGVWQVNGKNKTTFDEMIRMDLFYTKNMSPLLDLKTIVKTVPSVLSQLVDSWRSHIQGRTYARRQVTLDKPLVE